MVNPGALAYGDNSMFMSGNDTGAKAEVEKVLRGWFGWKDIIDLGHISQARGMEMYLPLWLQALGGGGQCEFQCENRTLSFLLLRIRSTAPLIEHLIDSQTP
jgi:predicted dinucleotide-binding enzyme